LSARTTVEQFDAGSLTPSNHTINDSTNPTSTSTGTGEGSTSSSNEGFLWKPESSRDGLLAILLPASISGNVTQLKLLDPSGTLLESGRFSGNTNGIDNYRFSKPGGSYPNGTQVVAVLNDGSTKTFTISDTSKRTTAADLPTDSSSGGSSGGSTSSGTSSG